jgi:hypothetical protein
MQPIEQQAHMLDIAIHIPAHISPPDTPRADTEPLILGSTSLAYMMLAALFITGGLL